MSRFVTTVRVTIDVEISTPTDLQGGLNLIRTELHNSMNEWIKDNGFDQSLELKGIKINFPYLKEGF